MYKKDVIKYYGNATKAAKAIGISDASFSRWGEIIPKGRACEIHLKTRGRLKAKLEDYA